ncbi:transposase [Deinococcus sp. QL22]|uniref:transposase n=1 Tax=Deinococcus sp. QL22 TaxID=2939437 RepID=UPI002017E3AE|nr:transposase [Deinococcus sp. QL22]UQN07979.1 transposase [Deinococcus sp. QL22]
MEEAEQPRQETNSAAVKEVWKKSDFLGGQIVWLLLRQDKQFRERDRLLFDKLKEKCPHLEALRQLAQGFRRLMPRGTEADLDAWLKAARESGFQDVRTFAVGLTRERAALLAAVTLPWSNGKAEGVVNRIKLVKRQMYG